MLLIIVNFFLHKWQYKFGFKIANFHSFFRHKTIFGADHFQRRFQVQVVLGPAHPRADLDRRLAERPAAGSPLQRNRKSAEVTRTMRWSRFKMNFGGKKNWINADTGDRCYDFLNIFAEKLSGENTGVFLQQLLLVFAKI
jgi:hypothetical protein